MNWPPTYDELAFGCGLALVVALVLAVAVIVQARDLTGWERYADWLSKHRTQPRDARGRFRKAAP